MMARQLRKPSGVAGHKVGLMMNKANEFLYEFTLKQMQLQPGTKILEIGFGNGRFFDKLFAAAPGLSACGIDFSATMASEARRNNATAINEGRLQIVQGSSAAMPFPDQYFDRIFCINVIYFWDEPQRHLEEIKRVLKPGGKFLATIRTRESMELMPFTKYGFTGYTPGEWEKQVRETGLQFLEAIPIDEPEVEFKEKLFRVQSLCLVAENKK
jgi:ubiquinone/menaquinone biosynthesis C-methylase UbiE